MLNSDLTRKTQLLTVLAGLSASAAGMVFFGLLGLIEGIPLILGACFAPVWPRVSKALAWSGALWASFWIVPFAVAALLPLNEPRPNIIVLVTSVPAVIFVGWLDVALIVDAVGRIHRGRSAPNISSSHN